MPHLIATTSILLHLIFILAVLVPTLLSFSVIPKTANKPIIALVPGAWHAPVHYTELIALLSHAGFRVTSQRLPSCDSTNPNIQSVAADAAAIRNNVLLPQLDHGNKVVLVMHSYGGSPGSMAARGLSLSERRAAGRPGGIIGLIVICGFLANEGQSLKSILPGGQFDPWVIIYVCFSLKTFRNEYIHLLNHV